MSKCEKKLDNSIRAKRGIWDLGVRLMLPDLPRPINGHILSMLPSSSALAVASCSSWLRNVLLDRESGALSNASVVIQSSRWCQNPFCLVNSRYRSSSLIATVHTFAEDSTATAVCLHIQQKLTDDPQSRFALAICLSSVCLFGFVCLLTGQATEEIRLDVSVGVWRLSHGPDIRTFFGIIDQTSHFIDLTPSALHECPDDQIAESRIRLPKTIQNVNSAVPYWCMFLVANSSVFVSCCNCGRHLAKCQVDRGRSSRCSRLSRFCVGNFSECSTHRFSRKIGRFTSPNSYPA